MINHSNDSPGRIDATPKGNKSMRQFYYYALMATIVLGQVMGNAVVTLMDVVLAVRAADSEVGLAAGEWGTVVFWRFLAALAMVPFLPALVSRISTLVSF